MPQFSIRDLMLLAVIVAIALGWSLDRRPIPARYQIACTADHVFVLDTSTGQVWSLGYPPGTTKGGDSDIHGIKLSN
jgi:hypothetical protein